MARRPYVASGNADPGALPVIAVLVIVTALVAGAVLGFVSQWLSLLLIFPLILGLVVGGVGAAQVKSRNMRMPMAMLGLALLGGVIAEGTLHLVKYWNVRRQIASDLESDPRAAAFLAENGTRQAVDDVLSGEDRLPPLLGYLEGAAKNGITITKAGHSSSSSSGPTLTGLGVYILWLVNLLIVCGVAAAMMVSQARKPFCEHCTQWYERNEPIAHGAGDVASMKQARLKLEGQQLAEAARSLGTSDGKSSSVLALVGCSKCNAHEPLIQLTQITGLKGNKPQTHVVYASLISPSEAAALREAVKA